MTNFIKLIFNGIQTIIDTLDLASFEFYGFTVSVWSLILVFCIISFFANVWWRGSKG